MTHKEAKRKSRELAKKYVKRYFKNEGVENFNFDKFGLSIVKMELHHAFKMYWPHWDVYTNQYTVMTLGNKIIER